MDRRLPLGVGNIAISFPYLDTAATRTAGMEPGHRGRCEYDELLPRATRRNPRPRRTQGLADGLFRQRRSGHWTLRWTPTRTRSTSTPWWAPTIAGAWRTAARARVPTSTGRPGSVCTCRWRRSRYYYWGELLDGAMFATEHGARWAAFADAVKSGACVSLHNDGSVSPPTPVVNIATAVTRGGPVAAPSTAPIRPSPWTRHWRAQTFINAARTLHREHLVGSNARGQARRLRRADRRPVDHRSGRIDRRGAGDGDFAGRSPGRPRRVPRCRRRCGQRRALPSGRPRRQGLLLKRRVSSLARVLKTLANTPIFRPQLQRPKHGRGCRSKHKKIAFW